MPKEYIEHETLKEFAEYLQKTSVIDSNYEVVQLDETVEVRRKDDANGTMG